MKYYYQIFSIQIIYTYILSTILYSTFLQGIMTKKNNNKTYAFCNLYSYVFQIYAI